MKSNDFGKDPGSPFKLIAILKPQPTFQGMRQAKPNPTCSYGSHVLPEAQGCNGIRALDGLQVLRSKLQGPTGHMWLQGPSTRASPTSAWNFFLVAFIYPGFDWVKNMYQDCTLGNGTKDQKMRNPC